MNVAHLSLHRENATPLYIISNVGDRVPSSIWLTLTRFNQMEQICHNKDINLESYRNCPMFQAVGIFDFYKILLVKKMQTYSTVLHILILC